MRGAEIKPVGAQGAAASAHKTPRVSPGYGEAGADGRGGKAGKAGWLWPTAPPHRVVRGFSAPTHRYGPGHRGIDISSPDPEVYAVQEGTVRFAGMVAGRPVVSVLHAGGLLSTYEPVVSDLRAGDPVRAGQPLGTVQPGHCAATHCLHLGARLGRDEYIDPLLLLRGWRPIVLKPLGAGVGLGEGGA
ncbi:M23 family metallopeptidase [Dermabacteraceae bacterium TAE3-ERU27]|nr:M23 family metallopeptidase [Dermabacteraceae bacterium TAE3-ERU27]